MQDFIDMFSERICRKILVIKFVMKILVIQFVTNFIFLVWIIKECNRRLFCNIISVRIRKNQKRKISLGSLCDLRERYTIGNNIAKLGEWLKHNTAYFIRNLAFYTDVFALYIHKWIEEVIVSLLYMISQILVFS